MKATPKIITETARILRKNMTPAEILLWKRIKAQKIGVKFYRQKSIFVLKENSGLDRYIIADFYAPQHKLIIELDGGIHNHKDIYILDKIKEDLLKNRGFMIIRFTNTEIIENLEYIIQTIQQIAVPCSLAKE